MIFTHHQIIFVDEMEKIDIGQRISTYGAEEGYIHGFGVEPWVEEATWKNET